MDAPEVRYARSGSVNIAYQVVGDGPVGLRDREIGARIRATALRGVPGEWRLYALTTDAKPATQPSGEEGAELPAR